MAPLRADVTGVKVEYANLLIFSSSFDPHPSSRPIHLAERPTPCGVAAALASVASETKYEDSNHLLRCARPSRAPPDRSRTCAKHHDPSASRITKSSSAPRRGPRGTPRLCG